MKYAAFPATPQLLATLHAERERLAQWAFAAAVRLSDQNRPLALKLCIECMIAARALMVLFGARRQRAADRRRPVHTERRPARRRLAPTRAAAQVAGGGVARTFPAGAPTASVLPSSRQHRSPWRRLGRTSLAGAIPASVQQRRRFLCMVGLHG